MTKKMLVDATHPEETRVAIVDGNWLSDFDFERASKKQLKGNIYLAKVIRIEPSLQAAFVEYGGNRHGFLPFSEIHPDYFRIPMSDRPADAPDEAEDEAESELEALEAAAISDADIAAHAEDQLAEDQLAHQQESAVLESAVAAEPVLPQESSEPNGQTLADIIPTSEVVIQAAAFDSTHTDDHGLITDFGNAATGPVMIADAPTPIETVGGESVEEERYRPTARPRYKIQEVVKRRQVMLIQVVKEERGNKGAALTSFLSLAGRYCVLMPNTDNGGGVSRKITSHQDRRRMKEILDQLEIPEGMAVILRTAGMEKDPPEIQRDLEYLLRLWNNIREQTLQSTAPALIYEEANLIKRSLRDLYSHDLQEILVAGPKGHSAAVDFMRTIMPDHIDKVKLYEDPVPLFFRYNVEKYIDQLYNPTVQLRSGGYIVINPTEALVSIDVNSGRATRERHIESTAVKTNLEAAEEIARQLRLRDLAGLIVIDFIDMEDGRNNAAVERRMKECMKVDRARLQIGRISPFGLMELSRQRLHPSLMEINFEKCPHCTGIGLVRSVDSAAISILRVIEEEALRHGASELVLHIPTKVALYILNQKRESLVQIEQRYNMQVLLHSDDALVPPDYRLERVRGGAASAVSGGPAVNTDQVFAESEAYNRALAQSGESLPPSESTEAPGEYAPRENRDNNEGRRGGRGRYGTGGRNRNRPPRNGSNNVPQGGYQERGPAPQQASPDYGGEADGNFTNPTKDIDDGIGNVDGAHQMTHQPAGEESLQDQQRRGGRRRGRRGGRGRRVPGEGHNREGGRNDQSGAAYRNRSDERSGERPNGNQGQPYAPQGEPMIPRSVHELDTTPREPSRDGMSRPSYTPPSGHPAEQNAPTHRSPYQIVSEGDDSDKPKGGWWRRLTGQ